MNEVNMQVKQTEQVVQMTAEELKQHQINQAWAINESRKRNSFKRNYNSAEMQRAGKI